MASPVTVIPTPGDQNSHMLFFLNDFRQQLAMEIRPVVNPARFTAFQDNGVPKGLIVNPSSLSAVLSNNVVSPSGRVVVDHSSSTRPFSAYRSQAHCLRHHPARPGQRQSVLHIYHQPLLQSHWDRHWRSDHMLGRGCVLRCSNWQ
jgi:hypothetical protein